MLFFCVQGPFYGKSTKNNVDNANSASYVGVFEANSLIRKIIIEANDDTIFLISRLSLTKQILLLSYRC